MSVCFFSHSVGSDRAERNLVDVLEGLSAVARRRKSVPGMPLPGAAGKRDACLKKISGSVSVDEADLESVNLAELR
jgi:hypothetical protein